MAKSKLRVEIVDRASPPPRDYDVFLELDGKTRFEFLGVDNTGAGNVEFELDGPAPGRLTIEKPTILSDAASITERTTVLLEDSHQYNGSVQGTGSKLRFVPNGFSDTKTQKINETTVKYETGPDVTVTVISLVIDPIPEFFVRASPGTPVPVTVPKDAQLPESFRPVAYVFPGKDRERRALIMSGVHGSEPEGVRIAEVILDELVSGNWVPEFSTVVVPQIIPRTQPLTRPGKEDPLRGDPDRRWVPRDRLDKIKVDPRDLGAEPNRNFPQPGESYASARERGRTGPTSELIYRVTGKPPAGSNASNRLLPETRLLLSLLERFRPERIATLHSHSPRPERGNSAGIFVDPRGGVDVKSDGTNTPEGESDDELTRDMVCAFGHIRADVGLLTIRDPLLGNLIFPPKTKKPGQKKPDPQNPENLVDELRDATVHYDPNASHAQGNSLGDWAPAAVAEKVRGVAAPRGNRPGITTVTVEFPHGESDETIRTLIRIHAEVVLSVFLRATQSKDPKASGTHIAAKVTQQDPAAHNEPTILKGCERRP